MKGHKRTKGPKATTIKTQEMIDEGYKPNVAAAAAHSMQRRGQLGPHGEYTHKTSRKPGPRGKQRRGA